MEWNYRYAFFQFRWFTLLRYQPLPINTLQRRPGDGYVILGYRRQGSVGRQIGHHRPSSWVLACRSDRREFFGENGIEATNIAKWSKTRASLPYKAITVVRSTL